MSLPYGNKDIIILKQGGKVSQYDENSRQIYTCAWEEVEHLVCVDHFPTSRGAEADTTTTHDLETSRQLETFYFSFHNQSHTCDIDIRHGYYVLQRRGSGCSQNGCFPDTGVWFWKVVACRTYEILPGCWDVKMTAERLMGRESDQMILQCESFVKQLQGVITVDHD